MEKQVLYHIHKIEGKDSTGKFWKENKEIKVLQMKMKGRTEIRWM